MINDLMDCEELANYDKLEYFSKENICIHMILKRKLKDGSNSWLNGYVKKINERLWIVDELKLGQVFVSINEIAFGGISEFMEVKN